MIYSTDDVKHILKRFRDLEENLRYVGESAEAGCAHNINEDVQEGLASAADQLLAVLTEIETKL